MNQDSLHCQACGRTYMPPRGTAPDALFCAICGGPLGESPCPEAAAQANDPFRGRKISGALLREKLAQHPTHYEYLARHKKLGGNVRVCVYPASLDEQRPGWMPRLFRLVAPLAQARSAHLLPLMDMGRLKDCYFITTDLVTSSLEQALEEEDRLEPKRAMRLMAGVLRGLAALSARGAVHGEITPHTILLDSNDSAILDYPRITPPEALNRLMVTGKGRLSGPALYVAPERALDQRRADIRSDLYSLGVVAYQMLAGRPPFEGKAAQQIMLDHVAGPSPSLSYQDVDIPEPLRKLVLRLMARDPADRPAGPQQALAELEGCAAEIGWPASVQERSWRAVPWTMLWTVVAVALLAAAIVPLFMIGRDRSGEESAPAPRHKTLIYVHPAGPTSGSLSDGRRRALRALVAYHASFCPRLKVVSAPQGARPTTRDALERLRQKIGANHLLLLTYSPGLNRRKWSLVFIEKGETTWLLKEECTVPEGGADWSELEDALSVLLQEAAARLSLEMAPGEATPVGGGPDEWLALSKATDLERQGEWRQALRLLEEAGADGPPFQLLRAFCAVPPSVQAGDGFPEVEGLARDRLPPRLAGLAGLLEAPAALSGDEVIGRFADYLARFPDSSRGYYLLGLWRRYAQGRSRDALAAYRQAVRLDPGYLPAAYACVDLLAAEGDEGLLAEFIREYEKRAPEKSLLEKVRSRAGILPPG